MKRLLRTCALAIAVFAAVAPAPSRAAQGATQFRLEGADSHATVGQAYPFTLVAVDSNGETDTNYAQDVRFFSDYYQCPNDDCFEVRESPDGAWAMRARFSAADEGRKRFYVIYRKTGAQQMNVEGPDGNTGYYTITGNGPRVEVSAPSSATSPAPTSRTTTVAAPVRATTTSAAPTTQPGATPTTEPSSTTVDTTAPTSTVLAAPALRTSSPGRDAAKLSLPLLVLVALALGAAVAARVRLRRRRGS